MAVEARHLNLFPSQYYITNRDFINTNQGNANIYNTQMESGFPLARTMPETLLPLYQSVVCDSVPAKTSMKSESGLTYNLPAPRKRSRDSFDELNAFNVSQKNNRTEFSSSFLGEDISFQIQQQQSEIDSVIVDHTEKLRMELYERRKQHSRMLVTAVQEGVISKLKEKEEEIQRMGKVNWVLQERVKTLCVENQIWRDLAQTNEATANSLRSNLEQVLAHVSEERLFGGGGGGGGGGVAADDDAESCCGSNDYGNEKEGRCMLAREGEDDHHGVKDKVAAAAGGGGGDCRNRMCRKCGEREACVLLLPCRHLCLCTVCGSNLHTCPVCNSIMSATLHVNMS
ncbi:hypothetical protein L1049_009541 [Liquidambar formosana]|uniref:RING-type domain-containing protein n=1 Tax=Liquidambar formosana TaxID=63359 RepID=A0AAP0N5V9_LIQFO